VARVLVLLDNRDSFTYNLAQAFEQLGARVEVREARRTNLSALRRLAPTHLVIGPGPGRPEAATLSLAALRALTPETPTLGVCLGFQALGLACGARVARSRQPTHGRTVRVRHDGAGVFAGLPSPLAFTRYNSLAVLERGLPEDLVVSARAENGEVMGLRHRTWPAEGVQFHPESVLSERGLELLANFLKG
jgi:anthranilate synthase/aminodeoxychorismate synthase-like glutamine amidotransferase